MIFFNYFFIKQKIVEKSCFTATGKQLAAAKERPATSVTAAGKGIKNGTCVLEDVKRFTTTPAPFAYCAILL